MAELLTDVISIVSVLPFFLKEGWSFFSTPTNLTLLKTSFKKNSDNYKHSSIAQFSKILKIDSLIFLTIQDQALMIRHVLKESVREVMLSEFTVKDLAFLMGQEIEYESEPDLIENFHLLEETDQVSNHVFKLDIDANYYSQVENYQKDLCAKMFICKHCRISYKVKMDLKEHLKVCSLKQNKIKQKGHRNKNPKLEINEESEIDFKKHAEMALKSLIEEPDNDTKKPQKVPCDKCNKILFSIHSYKEHITKVHRGENSFFCDNCCKGFVTELEKLDHQLNCKAKRCPDCHTVFRRAISKKHLCENKLYLDDDNNCLRCGLMVEPGATASKHRPFCKRIKCEICGEAFITRLECRDHISNTHQKDQKFPCTECPKTFSSASSLYKHNKDHSKDLVYICDRCPAKFTSKYRLSYHLRYYHGETKIKQYKCKICSIAFAKVLEYRAHMLEVHNQEYKKPEPTIPCHLCSKKFRSMGNLKDHQAAHEEPQYQCKLCDKKFRWSHTLTEHMFAHEGIRPYSCSVCKETFLSNRMLKNHAIQAHGLQIKGGLDPQYKNAKYKMFLSSYQ